MKANPEEDAKAAVEMFCRAAEKATGDCWEVQRMETGSLGVVQVFKDSKKALSDQSVPAEEKELVVTGCLYCAVPGGFADLAETLARTAGGCAIALQSKLLSEAWPLPFLAGCGSAEEMSLKLAACSPQGENAPRPRAE